MNTKEKFTAMIEVDFDEEILYSTAETQEEEPEKFICAQITLKSTPALRKFTAEKAGCDASELRNFYMDLDKYYFDTYNYRLYFYCGKESKSIVLSREEQDALYDCVDKQFREREGIGCLELLEGWSFS